jgi:hypothetical protein
LGLEVIASLDTLVVAGYVLACSLSIARPGPPGLITDEELVALAVAQAITGLPSRSPKNKGKHLQKISLIRKRSLVRVQDRPSRRCDPGTRNSPSACFDAVAPTTPSSTLGSPTRGAGSKRLLSGRPCGGMQRAAAAMSVGRRGPYAAAIDRRQRSERNTSIGARHCRR